MIKKSAEVISDWLINSGAVDENERELYFYASYSFLLSLAPLLLACAYGIIMNQIKNSIILIIPFVCIRKFSGGYHTRKSWTCMITSSVLLCICIYLSNIEKYNLLFGIIMLISAICIMLLSPIDSDNRKLDVDEKRRYKIITICVTAIFTFLATVGYALGENVISRCISIGIILTASLQIPCILRKN